MSASLTDFKPLRQGFALPPLLKRRDFKWGFFTRFAMVNKGSTERGAGTPQGLTEG